MLWFDTDSDSGYSVILHQQWAFFCHKNSPSDSETGYVTAAILPYDTDSVLSVSVVFAYYQSSRSGVKSNIASTDAYLWAEGCSAL